MGTTWAIPYRHERDRIVLARLGWCAALSLLGSIVLALQVDVLAGAGGPYLPFVLGYGGVSLLTAIAARFVSVQTRVTVLVLAYVEALVAVMALQYVAIPSDASNAAVGFVAVMLGVTVLLPWGFAPQLAVAVAASAGFAWVVTRVGTDPSGSTTAVVVSVAVVSVVAARLLERYRATSFKRAWQQEQLLSLARALAARTSVDDIVRGVLEYGLRLVSAEVAVVSLRDAPRGLYRVHAVDGPNTSDSEWLVGVDIPEDFPGTQHIIARDTLVVPDEAPSNAIHRMLRQAGYSSALYAVMRSEDDIVGILTFVRKDAAAFTNGDRMLARGLADQGAVALRIARLIDDLRRANQMKSEFLSTMSHELRTPLNVILGYAEMVEHAPAGNTDRQGMLERIQSAGRELLELIDNTLEIGKLDVGRSDVRLERVWLPDLFAKLERGCEQLPRAAAVTLQWAAGVPEVAVRTDPRKLTVAVRNLVGNALKFTERGWVRVEAAVVGTDILVRIADTGIGIAKEDQPRVFEMFRQGDGSDTRRFGGAGLGLYLVRQFTEQLGGALALESAPGQGSVFTLTLPVDVEQATSQPVFSERRAPDRREAPAPTTH